MRRVSRARAHVTPSRFAPSARAAQLTGRPLAGTGNPRSDAQLALLCQLQVSALSR
jgi:hypothetical protein